MLGALPLDEVHVWRASLDQPAEVVSGLFPLLCSTERERAGRFRFERDRARYVVGRALLRQLLGGYLGLEPQEVEFGYGAFEKPFVAREDGPWFNLSHSGPVALYAFSSAAEIGIDVEVDERDYSRERIAERFFSPTEVAALRALPGSEQPRAFLRCWTRKEAFVKARGDGLSLSLDSFDVSLHPDAPAALLRTAWSEREPVEWGLEDLSDPAAGYIAAVAQRAPGWHVRQLHLMEPILGREPRQEDQ
jgi:4'-phosphopantetheinyl transferase